MRLRLFTTAAIAGALLLGACASDDEAASAPQGAEPVPQPLVVSMTDYAYGGLPAELPVGTTLTVRNGSDTELHELVAIRLPDDEERSAEELVALPPGELAAFFPEVRTVLLQAPGSEDVIPAVGDGTLTEVGRYLFICAIPTGADPGEYLAAAAESEEGPPQVDGGPPHLVQGMWAEATVVDG